MILGIKVKNHGVGGTIIDLEGEIFLGEWCFIGYLEIERLGAVFLPLCSSQGCYLT